ncbi:hypothetical protein PY254_08965 [Rhodanobacter sp. AS-Z3]|uniref:hypothetical protein n=1 Tax=Rhodanobacter sp. AS-Z3 TaxID=3031330 RepID=UPI00247AE13A|nr:hypothetical protein [Rhodanobacter sp. AS-Z3]WEN13404.1 hypothetical protein PY254_08965 [Rhodanobacter sp. AS-Z3]
MKYLLCFIALVIPRLSMAVVDPAPLSAPQTTASGSSGHAARHHPLIEVRFVLISAQRQPQDMPTIDLGDQRSAIAPLSLKDGRAVLLRGSYVNPNMYWCTSWGCMPGAY